MDKMLTLSKNKSLHNPVEFMINNVVLMVVEIMGQTFWLVPSLQSGWNLYRLVNKGKIINFKSFVCLGLPYTGVRPLLAQGLPSYKGSSECPKNKVPNRVMK